MLQRNMPADDKPFRPDPVTAKAHLDAFVNFITGVGTPFGDKTQGGLATGPDFFLRLIRFAQAEARYRGSDLGRNIVDKPIDEMLRRGLGSVEVQPSEDEAEIADPGAHLDAALRNPRAAAAAWRRFGYARRDAEALRIARRWDVLAAMPAGAGAPPSGNGKRPPPPPPGPLPQINADGLDIADAIEEWAGNLPTNAGGGKGAITAISQALRWERAFGGGCVFIGVDEDGPSGVTLDDSNGVRLDARAPGNLTAPLDPKRVRRVTHLTALRGGVDGVVTMWRPYRFAISPKFGLPEIFQVQNSTVPIAAVPAPGEFLPPETWPASPSGPTLFYVHESRFLIFDGEPTSIEARQEMNGWGDSIFTRVNDPLLQFEQGWQAVGILMQEASIASEGIEGFTRALAEKDPAAREAFLFVAQTKALMRSVARTNYHDASATFTRQNVTFAGLADLLDRQVDRIAAAAEEPVSVLFGNLKGGLGAKEDPSTRGWYATIEAKREKKLRPAVEYLYRLGFKSKEGPTRGVEPDKWSLTFPPLRQLDELEQADLYLKTTQADQIVIDKQMYTPEEVAATRSGGAQWNGSPSIVMDMDARTSYSAAPSRSLAEPPAVEDAPAPTPEGAPLAATSIQTTIPPIRMMPTDPLTGTPASTPSRVTAERSDDFTPEHAPAGSPEGGQFVGHGASGGGTSAPAGKGASHLKPAMTVPVARKEGGKPAASPGKQLDPAVVAKLKSLGVTKLPAAHIAEVKVSEHLNNPAMQHKVMLIQYSTIGKNGKPKAQSGYSAEHDRVQADKKFARVLKNGPAVDAKMHDLETKAQTSPAHAAALTMAETALRPGSMESKEGHGHYGVTTMEARHVTFSGNTAKIEYVGKEGKTNVATVHNPALVSALKTHTEGKAPTDRVFNVTPDQSKAALPAGVLNKDLRTLQGTRTAEAHLATVDPHLTGDAKKDARHIIGILKETSTIVSTKLNNTPAMARKSYIAPQVIQAWGAKHGVNAEWLK